MSRVKGKRGPTPRSRWQPLVGGWAAQEYLFRLEQLQRSVGMSSGEVWLPAEVWSNDEYQVVVRYADMRRPDRLFGLGEPGGAELEAFMKARAGGMHLSLHKHGRHAVRDWRDLQQIKTEVAGAERVAYELFPAESQLVDTSNEYHLWVLPEGGQPPLRLSFAAGTLVFDHTFGTAGRIAGADRAKQRPFRLGQEREPFRRTA